MKVASPSGGRFGSAHAPGAARGGRHQPDGQRASAQTLVGNDGAAVFDAVRPLDHQGQRYVDHGHALAVAQQRCDLHGFSRAVDAALRIDKSVEPGGDRAAGDAGVGQIEGRRFETQEGVIAVAVACDQHGRRQRALAARQIGFEMHVTGVGGAFARKDFVATREQPYLDRALGLGRIERMHERVDAVVVGKRGEPQIGDDEPLGRNRIKFILERARGPPP